MKLDDIEPSVIGLGTVKREKENKVYEVCEVKEWFKRSIKAGKQISIEGNALDVINKTVNDEGFDAERFIDSLITYQDALMGENVSLIDYVNAIKFCSFLEIYEGNSTKAYAETFRERDFVKDKVNCPTDSREYKILAGAASRYRKMPLVVNILTQAEVPLYLMFQGYRYKAVSVLVREMEKANLSRDRINAADKLLTHLKPPENYKIELDVGIKTDNIVNQYEAMLKGMVEKQKELLLAGERVEAIANSKESYLEAEIIKEVE